VLGVVLEKVRLSDDRYEFKRERHRRIRGNTVLAKQLYQMFVILVVPPMGHREHADRELTYDAIAIASACLVRVIVARGICGCRPIFSQGIGLCVKKM
jgi:hypothetical protein